MVIVWSVTVEFGRGEINNPVASFDTEQKADQAISQLKAAQGYHTFGNTEINTSQVLFIRKEKIDMPEVTEPWECGRLIEAGKVPSKSGSKNGGYSSDAQPIHQPDGSCGDGENNDNNWRSSGDDSSRWYEDSF